MYFKQDHGEYMTLELIRRFGLERVEEIERSKSKRKPTIDDLVFLVNKYSNGETNF
jgi:hypothetical protein